MTYLQLFKMDNKDYFLFHKLSYLEFEDDELNIYSTYMLVQ